MDSESNKPEEQCGQVPLDVNLSVRFFGLRRYELFNSAVDETDSGTPLGAVQPEPQTIWFDPTMRGLAHHPQAQGLMLTDIKDSVDRRGKAAQVVFDALNFDASLFSATGSIHLPTAGSCRSRP